MKRPAWTLTVRHGSRVSRSGFDHLEEAVAELGRQIDSIAAEGGLPAVQAFRDYGPGSRIHARLEIAARGLLRAPTAGVDLMGDGARIPYSGAVRRRPLEPEKGEDAPAAVERRLREATR